MHSTTTGAGGRSGSRSRSTSAAGAGATTTSSSTARILGPTLFQDETNSSANPKYIQQYLRSIIIHSLDTLNYQNAEFASERLLALMEQQRDQQISQQQNHHQQQQQQQQQQQRDEESDDFLDSMYLYCLVLYRQDKYKTCYFKLSNLKKFDHHLSCSFLYGKCCLKLNKFKEGIFHLIKTKKYHDINNTNNTSKFSGTNTSNNNDRFNKFNYEYNRNISSDISSIYHILGDLYREVNDLKNSCMNYTLCLKLNQFDFEAFQKLCKLGVNIRVKSIFKFQHQPYSKNNINNAFTSANANSHANNEGPTIPDLTNPFTDRSFNSKLTPSIHVDEFNFSTPRVKTTNASTSSDAPLRKSNLNNGSTVNTNSNNGGGTGHTNNPNSIAAAAAAATAATASTTNNSNTNHDFEFTKPNYPDDKRKSQSTYSRITSRLISQPQNHHHHHHHQQQQQQQQQTGSSQMETPKKRNLKRNNSATLDPMYQQGTSASNSTANSISGIGGATSPATSSSTASASSRSSSSSIIITKEIEKSEKHLLQLYLNLGKSYRSMCKYDCYKAIRMLETSLNEFEKNTPWVLSKLGRLHYEIVNYPQSEFYFTKLRRLDRTRLQDMEYYSTLLWHLNKKVELTYLANELHDLQPNAAITWCVIGNLFSLIHEPNESIKCFNRAIKLDKKFTYAYTLKGHEYFSNDNYEMALENFRISLLLDPRHYNALYGLGMIYINLGDYEKADYHFRKAISINPINIILICCCGMVLEKLNKRTLAIKQYELAHKLQPLNPLPIFKLGQLYFSLKNYSLALKNFEILKNLAPNEASVHFLLGQLYNLQNDKFLAIKEFTVALNLDPKGNYLIREAMESLKKS
ncbi:anaphase-promoting complex subunit, putative [Candida dubliniensis CD36]|uniref:Anaphase-promoting complex subunit, putative n=1 Tax=Candida dubliniensis (strain CD36 / ATCC MYA-646 / CBS 7987 / NCPF 3949 / NRRL Y-17841) TaxID=573826 RepID=B9WKV8_CANDC|nr:anaphase-promoting complex subunit, putative [Candida dubliniensis CD36]CAX39658.1 anaphase-promoting complex subunit, putative [Candida dubliniensis CD36]